MVGSADLLRLSSMLPQEFEEIPHHVGHLIFFHEDSHDRMIVGDKDYLVSRDYHGLDISEAFRNLSRLPELFIVSFP